MTLTPEMLERWEKLNTELPALQDEDAGMVTHGCYLGFHALCSGNLCGDKNRQCRCLCHNENWEER